MFSTPSLLHENSADSPPASASNHACSWAQSSENLLGSAAQKYKNPSLTWNHTEMKANASEFWPISVFPHYMSSCTFLFYNLKKSLCIHIKLLLIQKLLINLIMYLRCSLWNKNKTKIIWNMCFIFGRLLLLHLNIATVIFFCNSSSLEILTSWTEQSKWVSVPFMELEYMKFK